MKNLVAILLISLFLTSPHILVYAETINETETELCESLQYALIISLSKTVDKAIENIYKDDKNAPEDLMWASYNTKILKVKQIGGIGGDYEITLKVKPYYRAHIIYGEDEIVVSARGKLIRYKHLKTYPKINFD